MSHHATSTTRRFGDDTHNPELKSPTVPTPTPENTRAASARFPLEAALLVKILYGVLAAVAVAAVPLMMAGKWFPSSLLVLTEGLLFLALAAARHNQARRSAWLVLLTMGLCVGALIATGKGPLDEAVLALPGLMIFASLFGSARVYAGLLAAITALLLGVATAHFSGWHVIPNTKIWPDTFVTVLVILSLTSYFVWLMASALRKALSDLVTENRRVRKSLLQIEQLAHHDALTSLPNRALARDRFERAMTLAIRNQTGAALLYLDLDNFKTVNDSLGHAAGDTLLCEVAGRLSAAVRANDTVSRQGGDEFLIVLSDIADQDAVAAIAGKLIERLTQVFQIDGLEVIATCSIGVALFPANGKDFDSVLKHADLAMYQAKDAGRNMFQFFDDQMNAHVAEHLHMIAAMRQALANGDFKLHYQPQFSLADQRVVGAEALLRWNHPEFGAVSPARFVPLAERCGLIVELGTWALHEACRQAKTWQATGLRGLVIAINVSPVQLRRPGLEEALARAIEETGIAANCIDLELTESLLLADSQPLRERLARLRGLGVLLSIDDFGTGYSNLSYLKKFDVQRLKIDQSFVRRMTDNSNDDSIVRAIVQIAGSLKLDAVAEGIEDPATLQRLIELGCGYGQGFLWSPALPADEFLRFVQARTESVAVH